MASNLVTWKRIGTDTPCFAGLGNFYFRSHPSLLKILGLNLSGPTVKDCHNQFGQTISSYFKGPWALVDLTQNVWAHTRGLSRCCASIRTSSGELGCVVSDIQGAVGAYMEGKASAYLCHAGLIDIVLPVWAVPGDGGPDKVCAAFIVGQYRPTTVDLAFVRKRADQYGLDATKLTRDVFDLPPVLPKGGKSLKPLRKTGAPSWHHASVDEIIGALEQVSNCLEDLAAKKHGGASGDTPQTKMRVRLSKRNLANLKRILHQEAEGTGPITNTVRSRGALVEQVDQIIDAHRSQISTYNILVLSRDNKDPEDPQVSASIVHRTLSQVSGPSRLMWVVPTAGDRPAARKRGRWPYSPLSGADANLKYWNHVRGQDNQSCNISPRDKVASDLGMEDISLYFRAFPLAPRGGNSDYGLYAHKANPASHCALVEARKRLQNGEKPSNEPILADCHNNEDVSKWLDGLMEGELRFPWWGTVGHLGHELADLIPKTPVERKQAEKIFDKALAPLVSAKHEGWEQRLGDELVDLLFRLESVERLHAKQLLALRASVMAIPAEHGTGLFNSWAATGLMLEDADLGAPEAGTVKGRWRPKGVSHSSGDGRGKKANA